MSLSERSNRITKLLTNNKSRASYIKAKLGVLVPAQIRALRLKSDMPRQQDLAREADMHQSRISMFETPGMANVTLETLARLAATFKTGLVVKFVSFHEMLRWENDFSQDAFDVVPRLEEDQQFLNPGAANIENERLVIGSSRDFSNEGASETTRDNEIAGMRRPMGTEQAETAGAGIGGA